MLGEARKERTRHELERHRVETGDER
jgi:hypothetical protein